MTEAGYVAAFLLLVAALGWLADWLETPEPRLPYRPRRKP